MPPEEENSSIENAHLLISEIRQALARGTKHYHPKSGVLLATDKEIIECLLSEGSIVFEPPETKHANN